MADQEEIFLNDIWTLYFHNPDSNDWSEASYNRICDISTIDDFIHVFKAYKELWALGNFFFMRGDVLPMWEDPANKEGGCMSFKIMKYDIDNIWFQILTRILGETFMTDKERNKHWNKITGISISPKRSYSICRIWLSDRSFGIPEFYDMKIIPSYTQVLFKEHTENKDFIMKEAG